MMCRTLRINLHRLVSNAGNSTAHWILIPQTERDSSYRRDIHSFLPLQQSWLGKWYWQWTSWGRAKPNAKTIRWTTTCQISAISEQLEPLLSFSWLIWSKPQFGRLWGWFNSQFPVCFYMWFLFPSLGSEYGEANQGYQSQGIRSHFILSGDIYFK